jgi:hypothetical protein
VYNKLLLTIVFSIYSFAIVSIKPVEVDKQKDTVLALGLGYKQLSGNTQKQEINLDTMIQKHFDGKIPEPGELPEKEMDLINKIEKTRERNI